MHEPVRLVVWDLDETFWRGTLTEGGAESVTAHKDLVIDLARRGIMSSICSKNDHATVEEILREEEVWDFFIFPSINWDPKGPRLHQLVEAAQLRPETVLFIDDNLSNLEEARQCVPGIQTCDQHFIASISQDPRFAGKDDKSLTRLAQYKALEQRQGDQHNAGQDVVEFLRGSDIQVTLDFDVTSRLDRVIELVNRTNQLNFTKVRLPESCTPDDARHLLGLDLFHKQAALVKVVDRYGDHGYCGFYVEDSERRSLEHFCFSCRVLGIGVEQWLYDRLGNPTIDIVGEVLTDLRAPHAPIDWINQRASSEQQTGEASALGHIAARGACTMGAVMHYFKATFPETTVEFNINRGNAIYRPEHTAVTCQVITGLTLPAIEAAKKIGYEPEDFVSRIFDRSSPPEVVLLNFASDIHSTLYRHRETGLLVPLDIHGLNEANIDLRTAIAAGGHSQDRDQGIIDILAAEYDTKGVITAEEFERNLRTIFDNLPVGSICFVLVSPEAPDHEPLRYRAKELNQILQKVLGCYSSIEKVLIGDMVLGPEDAPHFLHYSRLVYYRIFEHIMHSLRSRRSGEYQDVTEDNIRRRDTFHATGSSTATLA